MSASQAHGARSASSPKRGRSSSAAAREVPRAELERRAAHAPAGERFVAAPARPGDRGDRRVQAPLALRRGARASARRCSDDPRRLRARRRGRGSRSSPRARTSAARWRTCAPPAQPAICRCCARTSSSRSTSCMEAARRRRRRRAADRRRARGRPSCSRCTAARARSGSRCSSRSTTRTSSQLALAAGAELIGINNRDLRDFSVDIEPHRDADGTTCPAPSRSSRSPGSRRRRRCAALRRAGCAACWSARR